MIVIIDTPSLEDNPKLELTRPLPRPQEFDSALVRAC